MGRPRRMDVGGVVSHVLNRANGKKTIFDTAGDFQAFEQVLREAVEMFDTRVLTYCIMPNHWHLVLWPFDDGELSRFVGWLTLTHTQRWHAFNESAGTGHLYQGRYKSFPIQSDEHLLVVCRYVERNALRASLATKAEMWRWCSLWWYGQDQLLKSGICTHTWPIKRPDDWIPWVNQDCQASELPEIRECVRRGRPYGAVNWLAETVNLFGLVQTVRGAGRPPRFATGRTRGEQGSI